MGKLKAHTVLSLFDILAIFASLHAFSEFNRVSNGILSGENIIEIQKPLGLFLLLLIIPIIHLSSLVNVTNSYKKLVNYLFVSIFILIIIFSFYLDNKIENKLIHSGYSYCQLKSEKMRFSEFMVFLKDTTQCAKL